MNATLINYSWSANQLYELTRDFRLHKNCQLIRFQIESETISCMFEAFHHNKNLPN